jgi:hypothetical protein
MTTFKIKTIQMKKLLFSLILLTLSSIVFFSCKKNQTEITEVESQTVKTQQSNGGTVASRETGGSLICPATTVSLIAGQSIDAGNVTVTNDANFIYVTYNTANGYVLTQTHLFVGGCGLIPVNNAGNPTPGRFPFKTVQNNTTTFTYQVPISAIAAGTCGCIAAHAVVVKYDSNGVIVDQQTAWGNGTAINASGNWGLKFSYCSCQ